MSDEMIDLATGDARLRRRLEAYAEYRLSPDLTTTSRMRARVLAHAHRHADLARADTGLTIVPPGDGAETRSAQAGRTLRRTAVSLLAAAALAGSLVGGAAAASAPGAALYEARLWIEYLTLPTDPSQRAIAELARLGQRLSEADAAARAADLAAVSAALAAYERIMAEASAEVLAADDPVAAAAFEAGLGRNVEVLQALIATVPPQAGQAIGQAVERAIQGSANAIDRVDAVRKPTPAAEGGGGSAGSSGGGGAAGTPKPTKEPSERPVATPKPTKTQNEPPAPPTKPTKTPRPAGNPGQGGPPGDAPG